MEKNEQITRKWKKKDWLFLAVALLVILLLWKLVPYGYAIFANRQLFERVVNFVPTEGSYIKINGYYYDENEELTQYSTVLEDFESQEALMDIIAQLEYGGHYTSGVDINNGVALRDPFFDILMKSPGKKVDIIEVKRTSCDGIGGVNRYPLKLDNYEALLRYCEALFTSDQTN